MTRPRTTRSGVEAPLVVYGANAVLELLRSGEPVDRLCLGRGPREAELSAAAHARGVRVEAADRPALDRLAGSPHHPGAVALDGLQDPRNLGAILRTARALGVGGVVLPRDRSVGVTPVVAAASAGLLFGLPVAQVPNLVRAMEALKAAGFWLVGLSPRGGTPPAHLEPPARPAVVAGGEGGGLRALVHRTCDFTASIPMASGVESLNVGVAVAIALYELTARRVSS